MEISVKPVQCNGLWLKTWSVKDFNDFKGLKVFKVLDTIMMISSIFQSQKVLTDVAAKVLAVEIDFIGCTVAFCERFGHGIGHGAD